MVQYMIPFPLDLWPWSGCTLRPNLSSNTIMSPSCLKCIRSKPLSINFNLIGNVLAQDSLCFRQPDIALGNIAAKQSFGG